MPNNVVDINLETATSGIPRDTFADVILIGDEPDVADPTYNTPQAYNDSNDVANAFGDNADVTKASEAVEAKGAEAWWVMMVDYTTHSNELIDGSDTSSVSSGTLDNAPVRGDLSTVTVMLDGTEQTVKATTESPPQNAASGEAVINFDTGELLTGDSTSGAGSGIEVTYDTLSWGEAKTQMEEVDLDIGVLADERVKKEHIGDLDELVTFAEAHDIGVPVAYESFTEYPSQEDAMNAYHAIGGYVPSRTVLPIGHGATDNADVAAEQAGALAVRAPWFDPMWDAQADYSFPAEYFREALVGEPGDPNTLEGGDSSEQGPVNVIQPVAGVQVLSNSVTTAGAASAYQYFDVFRTEAFIAEEVENALTQLQLSSSKIPFAPNGRTMIVDALRSRLRSYVTTGQLQTITTTDVSQNNNNNDNEEDREVRTQTNVSESGAPLSDLRIRVPRVSNLPDSDVQNRVWSGIRIEGTLASNAHTFSVALDVQM